MGNLGRLQSPQTGAALVIAILVLFVLTVLGLALMLSTATEADIAVNHRWEEMAFYNADAGLEFGKNVLAAHYLRRNSFGDALPQARAAAQMNQPPMAPSGAPAASRDNQYFIQQGPITVYIGKVLYDPSTRKNLEFDFRQSPSNDLQGGDVDGDDRADVQGTVTVWVRRPISGDADYARDDRVIVTAEGTAPNYEGAGPRRSTALRRLEMMLRVPAGGASGEPHATAFSGTDNSPDAKAVRNARTARTY